MCGTPSVSRAIGVDREPGMLAVARRRLARHPHVEIVEGALEAVPVADASADLALLVLVLHHLPEPGAALAEARRILKPSGKLVVVDMQPHETTAWRTFGHLHQGFSAATVSALAATAGLEVTRYDPLEPEAEVQGPPLFLSTMAVPSSQAAPGPARAKSDPGACFAPLGALFIHPHRRMNGLPLGYAAPSSGPRPSPRPLASELRP